MNKTPCFEGWLHQIPPAHSLPKPQPQASVVCAQGAKGMTGLSVTLSAHVDGDFVVWTQVW